MERKTYVLTMEIESSSMVALLNRVEALIDDCRTISFRIDEKREE